MSDVIKDDRPRPPIDLDEFERQLRDMQAKPKHASLDPLAELARIVGQDDSFQPSRSLRLEMTPTGEQGAPQQRPTQDSLNASLSSLEEMIRPQSPPSSGVPPKYASPLDELAAISAETGPAPDFLQVSREPAQAPQEDISILRTTTLMMTSRGGGRALASRSSLVWSSAAWRVWALSGA